MDRTEIRLECVDCIHVVRDGGQGVGSCEFGNDILGSKQGQNLASGRETTGFSKWTLLQLIIYKTLKRSKCLKVC
jgi:hypothetical protein